MAHPFELTHEIEVDASPEEVWEAIATGPGVDAWFVPARVEDGRVALDLGDGMADAGHVTVSEPPHPTSTPVSAANSGTRIRMPRRTAIQRPAFAPGFRAVV